MSKVKNLRDARPIFSTALLKRNSSIAIVKAGSRLEKPRYLIRFISNKLFYEPCGNVAEEKFLARKYPFVKGDVCLYAIYNELIE